LDGKAIVGVISAIPERFSGREIVAVLDSRSGLVLGDFWLRNSVFTSFSPRIRPAKTNVKPDEYERIASLDVRHMQVGIG
jgi:hypothetical protein